MLLILVYLVQLLKQGLFEEIHLKNFCDNYLLIIAFDSAPNLFMALKQINLCLIFHRLTSPFNKRKVKEINNVKEDMLQGQRQPTSSMPISSSILNSGIPISGIPMKQKLTTTSNQTKPSVSGLPVYNQQTPKKKQLVQPSVVVNIPNKSSQPSLRIGVSSYSSSKLTESKLSGKQIIFCIYIV